MSLDIRRMGARIWKILKPESTPWKFVTSSGLELSIGLPIGKLLSGGGAGGHFYVRKDGDDTIYSLGYGAGSLGAGLSPLPVGVSDSEFDWPAQGLGHIWKLPVTIRDDPPDSFMGAFLMQEGCGSVSPLVSSGLGAYGASLIFLGGLPMACFSPYFALSYRYVGVIYGSSVATPGIGVTEYLGMVVTKSIRK